MLAAAINTPVSVMETAGEGGAWGVALLAAYMLARENGETLAQLRMPCARSGHVGVLEAVLPEQPCVLTLTCRLLCEGETLEEHVLPVYVGALGPLEAAFS